MAKTKMNQKSTDYRIICPLAIGGMAKVDLAENMADRTQVVFKRIRTDFKFREDMQKLFAEEQKLNRRLDSPHVVRMLADGNDEGGPYMIFEWINGTDLEQVLAGVRATEEPLPLNQALLIAYYIAQGLAYLHNLTDKDGGSLGLIHRDLSPGNILISNTGEVKIADFGIAKSEIKDTQTVVGELKGKFAYMAPEQTRGEHMDHRVDLFALGIVIWECCMAQSLFDSQNNMDALQKVRERQAPTLITLRNEVPEELSSLVVKLLNKDPDQRPLTTDEVVKKLEEIVYAQGLFDGHKRLLTQLARQYPRKITFQHIPSGGATRKTSRNTEQVLVKQMSQEAAITEMQQGPPQKQKGLFIIALGIMILLGVLIGLNLSSPKAPTTTQTVISPPPATNLVPPSPQAPTPQNSQNAVTPKKASEPRLVPPKKSKKPTGNVAAVQGFGHLQLTSSPWGWVEVDGQKLKKHTPIKGLRLSAGPHQVRVFNPELQLEQVFKITIVPNKKLQKMINLSTGAIR